MVPIYTGKGNLKESATENIPPEPLFAGFGKGEIVR